jgi:hypothetical protein
MGMELEASAQPARRGLVFWERWMCWTAAIWFGSEGVIRGHVRALIGWRTSHADHGEAVRKKRVSGVKLVRWLYSLAAVTIWAGLALRSNEY